VLDRLRCPSVHFFAYAARRQVASFSTTATISWMPSARCLSVYGFQFRLFFALRGPHLMYLLVSVHRVEDVPLRLYPSHEIAMAYQCEWIPAQTDSEFQGFRLVEFGIDGSLTGRSEFFEGEEMAYVPCLEASSACLPRREPVTRGTEQWITRGGTIRRP
jgi:hypothetical protein